MRSSNFGRTKAAAIEPPPNAANANAASPDKCAARRASRMIVTALPVIGEGLNHRAVPHGNAAGTDMGDALQFLFKRLQACDPVTDIGKMPGGGLMNFVARHIRPRRRWPEAHGCFQRKSRVRAHGG